MNKIAVGLLVLIAIVAAISIFAVLAASGSSGGSVKPNPTPSPIQGDGDSGGGGSTATPDSAPALSISVTDFMRGNNGLAVRVDGYAEIYIIMDGGKLYIRDSNMALAWNATKPKILPGSYKATLDLLPNVSEPEPNLFKYPVALAKCTGSDPIFLLTGRSSKQHITTTDALNNLMRFYPSLTYTTWIVDCPTLHHIPFDIEPTL